jgi:Tfp pilus assembly protein PilF
MTKRFALITCALIGLLCAAPAVAQFGALEGDVKDAEGKPMVGAQILIERKDIKGTYKTKTDKKGHYYHGGLPLGTFKISLMDGERVLIWFDNVRVRPGDPQVMNFDLKAEQMRQQAAQAGLINPNAPAGPGQDVPRLSKEQLAKLEEAKKKDAESRRKAEELNTKFASGMEALRAKNCDVAVTDLAAAAELDPKQHVVWANLAEAQFCVSKTKTGDERKAALDKGIEAYKKAIELKPDDASYHNNYGLGLVQAGDIAGAQAELSKAAQIDPVGAGRYFFNLGAVLTNNGKLDEAAEAFRQATVADPNYAEAYYQYANSLWGKAVLDTATGKTKPAPGQIEAFQKYLELAPNGPNAANAKGMIDSLGGQVQTEIKSEKPKSKKKG